MDEWISRTALLLGEDTCKMLADKHVMIVGVGGQGSLLASRLIGNVLLSQGFDFFSKLYHTCSSKILFFRISAYPDTIIARICEKAITRLERIFRVVVEYFGL